MRTSIPITGPDRFTVFERVIETFKLTDEPIRFKPVDIYYHFYAGTKPASIVALQRSSSPTPSA